MKGTHIMKAAVLFRPGDLRIADFAEPPLAEDGVKIAVSYCGICGTDFHKFSGRAGSRPVKYPVPLGHEVSGIVTEVGARVTDFKPGDRVAVDPNWSCGHCWYCQNGKRHLCSQSRGVVKGMAEFVCPPQENVYRLPEGLSLRDAALTEPLSCCLHGVDQLDIQMGETVAIVGFGAIGQLMLQLLHQSAAANIIVIEPIEANRQLAMEMGATWFINPDTEDIADELKEIGIPSIEKVIECAGLAVTAQTAVNIAGRGATVVLFGVSDPESMVSLPQYDLFTKELTIKTSYINPYTTGRAIKLLSSGAIDTDSAIRKVIDLEDVPEEIASRHFSRQGKVLVRIRAESENV